MTRSNNHSHHPGERAVSHAFGPSALRLLVAAIQIGSLGLAANGMAHAQPVVPAAASQSQQQQAMYELDIPAQPLASAIAQFSSQTGADLFSDGVGLGGLSSNGVAGRYTLAEGLQQLLAGTGLGFRYQAQSSNARPTIQLVAQGQALELAPINVRGTPIASSDGEWVYHEPRSVSVITREQIDKRPPRHAADMLADTPGVTSAVNRHDPGLSVNIRGMQDFGRVNMMIDGMRQNHVESGHQQRNGQMYIDSELLSSVVIEKGPNAGVYGANAIAGSANFRTLDYDDIILPGQDHGVRLRGATGVGGDANGAHFLGSVAVAGRLSDRLELLAARSQKKLGEYNMGNRGRGNPSPTTGVWDIDGIEEVRYSDQQQDSWLAKARLKLTDEQSLQFTYVDTSNSYNNVSDTFYRLNRDEPYRGFGRAEAESTSYALDYAFSPSNPLIDLNAKVYFVTTENERVNNPGPNAMADTYWQYNLCQGELDEFAKNTCLSGMRQVTTSRTDTLGFQLENTSVFQINMPGAELSANYGIEWFQDEGKSSNRADRDGVSTPFLDEQVGNNLNPNGLRDVASAFASLTFQKEPFTLKAGLRYDWYHLRGNTTVPGAKSVYSGNRLATFTNYYCGRNQNNAINATGCALGQQGDEAAIAAWYETTKSRLEPSYQDTDRFKSFWTDEYHRYEYDVDRSVGKFSPFLSAAYKPLDWLEFFGNWGKGFRPPSLTETLWEGDHGGSSSSSMYPNPLLDAERSTSWELGFNILRQNLLQDNDRLGLKMAYFSTKADNYITTIMSNTLPGQPAGIGMGNTFFQNNLTETRFKGIELEANYDAGLWYGGLNYTKYLSGENKFCSKVFPVGSQSSRYDQPNEDGSMTPEHLQAIAEGYGSVQEKLDAMSYCGIDVVLNTAAYMPLDQHGAHAGIRLFDRTLDMGIRYSRAKGDTVSHYEGNYDLWDSYTTWDFYAKYQPVETFAISLAVENIRDENYLSAYSDSMSRTYAPGRTVQAGLELRF